MRRWAVSPNLMPKNQVSNLSRLSQKIRSSAPRKIRIHFYSRLVATRICSQTTRSRPVFLKPQNLKISQLIHQSNASTPLLHSWPATVQIKFPQAVFLMRTQNLQQYSPVQRMILPNQKCPQVSLQELISPKRQTILNKQPLFRKQYLANNNFPPYLALAFPNPNKSLYPLSHPLVISFSNQRLLILWLNNSLLNKRYQIRVVSSDSRINRFRMR